VIVFQTNLEDISRENPDAVGDLHLDIAEAYMSVGQHGLAKPLLLNLVSSTEYNKASFMFLCISTETQVVGICRKIMMEVL